MEISITESSIVLKRKALTSFFSGFFPIIFGLAFSIPSLAIDTLSHLGDTDLTCQRISANLVNCKKTKSNFWELLPGSSKSFTKITGAEYSSKEELDSDGNLVTVLTIQLVNDRQVKEKVFDGRDWDNDPKKMINITMCINFFIKSNAPTFFWQQENHYVLFREFIRLLPFLSICLLNFLPVPDSETWDFNKSRGLLIHEIKTSTGTNTRESLINFQEIQIIECKYSDGDFLWYQLKLLYKSVDTSFYIFTSSKLSEVEEIAIELSDFLQIPINKVLTVNS